MSAAQENTVTVAQAQFEDWYVQNAFDYAANPIGSRDCGLMRRAWHAALAARQPRPGNYDQSAEDRFEQFVQAEIARSPGALRELGEYLGRVLDEDEFPQANSLLLQLATQYTAPPAQGMDLGPRPMDTAPRDGTMVRLLVQFTEHATEDTDGPAWTIGANNGEHDGGDLWCFAGWCWTHDHFTEGKGTPVGWLPLIDGQRDAAPGVANA